MAVNPCTWTISEVWGPEEEDAENYSGGKMEYCETVLMGLYLRLFVDRRRTKIDRKLKHNELLSSSIFGLRLCVHCTCVRDICMGRGGSLVYSSLFVRWVVGSNPALAAT